MDKNTAQLATSPKYLDIIPDDSSDLTQGKLLFVRTQM